MKLSIQKCSMCNKTRLVDRVKEEWVCFACKQNINKKDKKPAKEQAKEKPKKK